MSIQKLRLQHDWSQQQLADASGLSVRTIQRLEAGNPASIESLKCLAAVFEVDSSTLHPERTMTTATDSLNDTQEEDAFAYVRKLRGFYLHLLRYIFIVLGLLAVNLILTPHRMWIYWVMGGWGLGLLMHAARVFKPQSFLGPQWERRQVEKRLGRPL
ncbi:helix-turn-helix domain-containing protein [uncultured Desulfobulbus sp.]|uniref:helix-turn-helix domain-containing protein n=1 Tax=uncultured Desulfobulbus sp. TaxID=239745 RepID=UPI0029C6F5C8|nr:helix-turn-helix domain-containing protein [uncultured Desulfobulbus sp.]